MAGDDADTVRGIEMNDAEIDDFLTEMGHGVLSLADGGEGYGVPMSFGYDGERLFMNLLTFGDDSEKLAFSEATDRAALIVYSTESRFRWRSVVARGDLTDVPEADREYMEEVMDDNSWSPYLFPPTSPMTGVTRLELEIDEATGRKGEEFQG